MNRIDGRKPGELRKISIVRDYLNHALASVLIEIGGTKVICSVTREAKVPPWMRAQNVPGGWITSEYAMLPAATQERTQREASRGRQSGRTMEIQRLIGRSLRAVADLRDIGECTLYVDCDVIDADGGTRCASITGASVALRLALVKMHEDGLIKTIPVKENVAAVSVGIITGEPVLDLCYEEDSAAAVDMNVVMTESGKFVEIQGTAEGKPFTDEQMAAMLKLARQGIAAIVGIQNQVFSVPARARGKKQTGSSFGNIGELLEKVHPST